MRHDDFLNDVLGWILTLTLIVGVSLVSFFFVAFAITRGIKVGMGW